MFNLKSKEDDTTSLLWAVQDLVLQPDSCPHVINHRVNNLDFKSLITFVSGHKVTFILNHFIECKYCSKYFSSKNLVYLKELLSQHRILSIFFKNSINTINLLFAKNHIKAFLYKDMSWLECYNNTKRTRVTNDIDILVDSSDWDKTNKILTNQNWRLDDKYEIFNRKYNYRYREYSFIKNNTGFVKIDLHDSPSSMLLEVGKNDVLKGLCKGMFKNLKVYGLRKPESYFQLLLAIIHFYYHDKCFGIRQAYEIKELVNHLESVNKLVTAVDLAKKNQVERIFWFTLFVIEKLFNQKLVSDKFQKMVSPDIVHLANYFPVSEIQRKRMFKIGKTATIKEYFIRKLV